MSLGYTNLRIWDGTGDGYRPDADCIVVEDAAIVAVGLAAELAPLRTIDAGGLTALPGLIDAHVHLCLDPALHSADAQLALSDDAIRTAIRRRCHEMLSAGITTARDLGGGRWLELEARDAVRDEDLAGPRLLCAGQPITSPLGHCHFWGGEADSLDAALAVLERQAVRAVDLIKVMATGGTMTPGSRPADAQFDAPTLAGIVAAARRRGYPVAAHCHGTGGIRNAAEAGVATIEHCSWVGAHGWAAHYEPEVARLIAARGVWVSPTVNVGWRRRLGTDETSGRVRANFAAMREAGVGLIASTDAGIPGVYHHQLAEALPIFADIAGLSPAETLRAASSDAAVALGLAGVTGRLAPGLAPDVLLVEGDPLADLGALASPVEVLTARGPTLGRLGAGRRPS